MVPIPPFQSLQGPGECLNPGQVFGYPGFWSSFYFPPGPGHPAFQVLGNTPNRIYRQKRQKIEEYVRGSPGEFGIKFLLKVTIIVLEGLRFFQIERK
jgi:hypothetical protein